MAIHHGTVHGYSNQGCKCPECRKAWAAYYLIYRARRRARGLCTDCSTPSPQYARCPVHRLLNAIQNAARVAALKKVRAMSQQVTAIAILLLLAALATACGEVRENLTGPSAIGGAPTPGQLFQSPVEILDRTTKGRQ